MTGIADLPEVLIEALAIAGERIGSDRALITFQGVISGYKPLRIIDGVIRHETLHAVNATEKAIGLDGLLSVYLYRLLERFPEEFADMSSWDEDEEDVELETEETSDVIEAEPVKKRRRAR